MKDPKSILLVKLSAIGDVVMCTPAAESVRYAYPDAHVAWLVEKRCKDAIIGNPYVDEVFVWDRSTASNALRTGYQQVRKMRSRHFDVAVDLQGLARSAFLTYLTGAKIRVGFANGRECSSIMYNKRVPADPTPHPRGGHLPHLLLEAIGITGESLASDMHVPLTDEDLEMSRHLLHACGVTDSRDIVALIPATTRRHKHWPDEYWSELADVLSERLGLLPVFLGGPNDVELIESIRSNTRSRTESLVGKTSLKVAAASARRAKLAVGVDTGLLHMSVAVGTPTIGLYGPTSEWRKHEGRPNFRVLMKEYDCAPCYFRIPCEQLDCMRAITVEDVASAAAELVVSVSV